MFSLISILSLIKLIVPHECQEILVDSFSCKTGNQTIFLGYRCDDIKHCDDGSDEDDCVCPPSTFRGSNGYCVSSLIEFVANRDCTMYDDQLVCDRNCTSEEFRCSSDLCINKNKLCDGIPDCPFSIDEWVPECKEVKDQLEANKKIKCPPNKLPCYTNEAGIYSDESYHCAYLYEECFHAHECKIDGCGYYLGCRPDEFICYNVPCLNQSLLCDGKWHCYGGVDESPIACLFKTHVGVLQSTAGPSPTMIVVFIFLFLLIVAIIWQIYRFRHYSSNRFRNS